MGSSVSSRHHMHLDMWLMSSARAFLDLDKLTL